VVPATVKPQRYLDVQGVGGRLLGKTMRYVSGMLFTRDAHDESLESGTQMKGKERETDGEALVDREVKEERFKQFGKELPKMWQILEEDMNTTPTTPMDCFGFRSPEPTKKGDLNQSGVNEDEGRVEGSHSQGMKDVLSGCKRVVAIGIHGWFLGICSVHFSFQVMHIESSLSGAMLRTVVGEVCLIPSHYHISNFYLFIQPTGMSTKFANMMEQALQQFEDKYGVKLIDKRVERYAPGLAP
jgi:hypothetical protein